MDKRTSEEMTTIRANVAKMVSANAEISPKVISDKLNLAYATAYQLVRKEKRRIQTIQKRVEQDNDLEARINQLEHQNKILLALAKEVRSDPSDCDLVTYANGFTVLHKVYGGYKLQSPGSKQWEEVSKFEDIVERIFQHK